MTTLPIDEMLSDLRAKLEELEREPSFAAFDLLQRETMRIERVCENRVFAYIEGTEL